MYKELYLDTTHVTRMQQIKNALRNLSTIDLLLSAGSVQRWGVYAKKGSICLAKSAQMYSVYANIVHI